MYGTVSSSGRTTTYCNEYWVDTKADMDLIPKNSAAPGSTVIVIDSGNRYILNSKKEWILLTNSTSSSSPSPEIGLATKQDIADLFA